VAGIAYAGDRGIQQVEVSADAGRAWTRAEFVEPPQGKDCWVRWQAFFTLAPGEAVTLLVVEPDGDLGSEHAAEKDADEGIADAREAPAPTGAA
jgi:hypothetical protein